MFMSFLSKINPTYLLCVAGILLCCICWFQQVQLDKTQHQLDVAMQTIQQYQQAQALTESANTKLTEHKEATRNEIARQQKITNEALETHKDWADAYLPESVLRLFSTETTTPDSVPSTDGASQ